MDRMNELIKERKACRHQEQESKRARERERERAWEKKRESMGFQPANSHKKF